MTAPPLPDLLVDRIERAATSSAAVLRRIAYEALAGVGVDVPRLVEDTRGAMLRERGAQAEAKAKRLRMLRERVAAGRLPPEKLERAKEQLARLPAEVKAVRAALKRIEHRPAPPVPSAPTRELVRHYGREPAVQEREVTGELLSAPRHVFEWPVASMAVAMTAEEYQAAERLRWAYFTRQNTARGVDWNGSGGGAPGSRAPIRDDQLRAGREWNAIWLRLDPSLRLIIGNFVLEEPQRGHERPLTAEEFGKQYGATRDARRALGVTTGAVRCACAVIARLFVEYDRWRAEQAREAGRQQHRALAGKGNGS